MIDAQTFEEILKDREKLFELPWEELRALSQQYPYSAHVWWLLLEKARLEQRPDYDQILEHVASRTFDRAFLYRYLRHLQTHASPATEHFQLAEDYLELKDLSELETLEAPTRPDSSEAESSQSDLDLSHTAAEEAFDEGERFSSLDEVFQFPEGLSHPAQKAAVPPDMPDSAHPSEPSEAPPPADEQTAPPAADSLRSRVLSLDDLLAELPQTAATDAPESEKGADADTPPTRQAVEPARPPATERDKSDAPAPPKAENPHRILFQQAAALAATGTHTARQMWQWLQSLARQAQPHPPATSRPEPLKRQQLESWQKLVREVPHHLFISADSEVEKPPLRHAEKAKRKRKSKKKAPPPPERIARQSLQPPTDVASEPLARVLEQQGHYERAIIMYERLRLKYPEKSDFFAAKIEELKQKL